MNRVRAGQLNYLNALPLYGGFLQGQIDAEVEWKTGYPSQLNTLLQRKEVDLSLTSSFTYLSKQDELELLPRFCIAASDEVQSVLLYIRNDVESITDKELALTPESETSAQLVKVLCERFWDRQPKFVPLPSVEKATSYPAFLLIGDAALYHPSFPGYRTIDLAAAWHEKTALPMTFAVFAATKEAMAERGDEIHSFMQRLEASYEWGRRNEGVILDVAQKQSGLDRKVLEGYYPLLTYRLGKDELAGLKAFATLSNQPTTALV